MQVSETPSTSVPPPPRIPPTRSLGPRPRSLNFALFFASIAWYKCATAIAASASSGLDFRFGLGDLRLLVQALMLLFLVILGLALLRTIEHRRAPLPQALGLPRRPTAREEWGTGAALGWGLAVASVVPMVLGGALNVQTWVSSRAFYLLGLGVLTVATTTLANALAIYGYGFHRLVDGIGPVRATIIVMALVAINAGTTLTSYGTPDGSRILIAMLAALLLCLCWIRTHGLWLLWGLHFAWAASIGLLFGLPVFGDWSLASVVDTRTSGPAWLTGGGYGPAAAAFSIVLLLVAIPVLFRVTDDYAWNYTRKPIVAGGYEVVVPPPAAHAEMEGQEQQSATPALVQILPVTPQSPREEPLE